MNVPLAFGSTDRSVVSRRLAAPNVASTINHDEHLLAKLAREISEKWNNLFFKKSDSIPSNPHDLLETIQVLERNTNTHLANQPIKKKGYPAIAKALLDKYDLIPLASKIAQFKEYGPEDLKPLFDGTLKVILSRMEAKKISVYDVAASIQAPIKWWVFKNMPQGFFEGELLMVYAKTDLELAAAMATRFDSLFQTLYRYKQEILPQRIVDACTVTLSKSVETLIRELGLHNAGNNLFRLPQMHALVILASTMNLPNYGFIHLWEELLKIYPNGKLYKLARQKQNVQSVSPSVQSFVTFVLEGETLSKSLAIPSNQMRVVRGRVRQGKRIAKTT